MVYVFVRESVEVLVGVGVCVYSRTYDCVYVCRRVCVCVSLCVLCACAYGSVRGRLLQCVRALVFACIRGHFMKVSPR